MSRKSTLFVALLSLSARLMPAANQYIQHNLVSDIAGAGADHVDPNLVNPWGICSSATSPFWISDNGTGLSTLYSSAGVPNATLKPSIPADSNSLAGGTPTGCVFNGTTTAFLVPNSTGKGSNFVFATESGTLSGWSGAVNTAQAFVVVDNSAKGAVYKGLALAIPTGGTPRLYAANFNAAAVEMYDQNWQPVTIAGAFTDPAIPAGFAPFNVQALGGKIYVTYAKQNAAKKDDVSGVGNGYVDIYDLDGKLLQKLIAGGNLNSPWGITIAPAGFGDYANDVLVGNFGDGAINVYNPTTGAFIAALQDTKNVAIKIPGLWALNPGNGGNGGDRNAVYFTAGTADETHGFLGSLQAGPAITANGIANAASFGTTISPGGFVTVVGANLASTTRTWTPADFINNKVPTTLDGVTATIDGIPAYVYFISPSQVNLVAPADPKQGPVQVVISNNGLVSASGTVTEATYAPAFFISKSNYIAATHADFSLIGPVTLFPNSSTPAKPGETIILYATGLGATNPPQDFTGVPNLPAPSAVLPTVTIGGAPATVTYSGMTFIGLFQINVVVPAATTSGDQPVVLTIGGVSSQAGALISVATN